VSFESWRYNSDNKQYTGTHTTQPTLPSGLYTLLLSQFQEPVAAQLEINEEDLHIFSEGNNSAVLKEVQSFWDKKGRYAQLGVTHKRGILLHGIPGCGKSAIMSLVLKDILDRNGLAFNCVPNQLNHLKMALPLLKQIEKDRPFLVILEDLETFIYAGAENILLEVMDGTSSMGNGILFMATTNYLNQIPIRLSCRPSRIDTLLEIRLPTQQQRREYLEFSLGKLKVDYPIEQWVEKTEEFNIAQLKELVVSVVIHEQEIDYAVERLKALSPIVNGMEEDEEAIDGNEQHYVNDDSDELGYENDGFSYLPIGE